MEPGGNAARARSGEREMGGVAASPAGAPRVRLRGGRRRDCRSSRAARRGRRLRVDELRGVRRIATHMSVRLLALVIAIAALARATAAQEVDRTLPPKLSPPTHAT